MKKLMFLLVNVLCLSNITAVPYTFINQRGHTHTITLFENRYIGYEGQYYAVDGRLTDEEIRRTIADNLPTGDIDSSSQEALDALAYQALKAAEQTLIPIDSKFVTKHPEFPLVPGMSVDDWELV